MTPLERGPTISTASLLASVLRRPGLSLPLPLADHAGPAVAARTPVIVPVEGAGASRTLAGTAALLLQRFVDPGAALLAIGAADGMLARVVAAVRAPFAPTLFLALPDEFALARTLRALPALLPLAAPIRTEAPVDAILVDHDIMHLDFDERANMLGGLVQRLRPGGRVIGLINFPPASAAQPPGEAAALLQIAASDARPYRDLRLLHVAPVTVGSGHALEFVLERGVPLGQLVLPYLAWLVPPVENQRPFRARPMMRLWRRRLRRGLARLAANWRPDRA